jgi:hypothetical protein
VHPVPQTLFDHGCSIICESRQANLVVFFFWKLWRSSLFDCFSCFALPAYSLIALRLGKICRRRSSRFKGLHKVSFEDWSYNEIPIAFSSDSTSTLRIAFDAFDSCSCSRVVLNRSRISSTTESPDPHLFQPHTNTETFETFHVTEVDQVADTLAF